MPSKSVRQELKPFAGWERLGQVRSCRFQNRREAVDTDARSRFRGASGSNRTRCTTCEKIGCAPRAAEHTGSNRLDMSLSRWPRDSPATHREEPDPDPGSD